MSDKNPYEKLAVGEGATFDEIQEARNRLVKEHSGDRKLVEEIEAAYDAILMDRLRLRQQGKIRVPDRIRFPEKLDPPPEAAPTPSKPTPDWLQRLIDRPTGAAEVLLPALVFLGMGALSFVAPAPALALGVGFGLYFLNRKENKFGRAFLLTLLGLVVGVVLGLQVGAWLEPQLRAIAVPLETFASIVTFVVLWFITSFLR